MPPYFSILEKKMNREPRPGESKKTSAGAEVFSLQFNLINLPNILHVLFNGTVGGELTDVGNV